MKKFNEDKQTFWVAYADLMAGLLFVFILLVGGIIVKYVLTQNSLNKKEEDFTQLMSKLKNQKEAKAQLEILNQIFGEKLNKLESKNKELERQRALYIVQLEELQKISKDLREKNLKDEEIKNKQSQTIDENEIKIATLLEKVSKNEKDFNKILNDLNFTKNRIKNLSGIRVKAIANLKEKLGNSIKIDPESGSLSLSSSVLFDKGSSVLKNNAKPKLKKLLKKYFSALLDDDSIRNDLDQIIIEGHTDSDGSYIYNLELSQQRAFEVMKFINSWNTDPRLKNYLIASGKSYMSPVMKNGKEDKDASRRIEIKFSLSNKDAIDQMQRFLQYDGR